MMSTLNRLQMRLWAAMLVFYALALTLGADPWRDCMVGCVIFGLLCIPARLVVASVEIADSLRGARFSGTQP